MWTVTGFLLATALVVGSTALAGLGREGFAVVLAFAGGAVLASLADTLMPTAYEDAGPFVAFATVAGLFLSFVLSEA